MARREYPDSPEMWVSHETIYLTLFVQGRGVLKYELTQRLPTHQAMRRPAKKRVPNGKGQIRNPKMISERPAEAEDRAVPGLREGDLLVGRRQTAIGTILRPEVAVAARVEREHQRAAPPVFPKTTDMASLAQDQLDQAAYSLNSRPRQTLGWMTPSQKLAEALR